MCEKIKFEQRYDDAFLGATGWGDNAPFIAYSDEWVVIVDSSGISFIGDDGSEDGDFSAQWSYSENYSYFTAKQIVKLFEINTIEELLAITLYDNPEFKRVC